MLTKYMATFNFALRDSAVTSSRQKITIVNNECASGQQNLSKLSFADINNFQIDRLKEITTYLNFYVQTCSLLIL